jgi:hypothetical protein
MGKAARKVSLSDLPKNVESQKRHPLTQPLPFSTIPKSIKSEDIDIFIFYILERYKYEFSKAKYPVDLR